MNTIRFRLRTLDLFLATFVIALVIVSAKEGPFYDTIYSHILLLVLAGMLGAVTSRIVSDKFRLGTVCGLLLGVLGYLLAVFLIALGIRLADRTVVSICVCTGGIVGGLIPTVLHRFSKASRRIQIGILLVGISFLSVFLSRCWQVSKQNHSVKKLREAGAWVTYWDESPAPMIFDSSEMIDSENVQPYSVWLRDLLGARVISRVTLSNYRKVKPYEAMRILVDELPAIENLSFYGELIDDELLEMLRFKQLPKLDCLRIEGKTFNDQSLSRLDPMSSLTLLDLSGTSITDESVEHLLAFPSLSILGIQRTSISAEGVKLLKSRIGRVVSDY